MDSLRARVPGERLLCLRRVGREQRLIRSPGYCATWQSDGRVDVTHSVNAFR
jgi:hypothetical protein